jgi:glycosyltransferase involved in cell wall biosynthesis
VELEKMRLLIVQYGGDYREAFYRLAKGGGETYHAQKYVIDSVAEIGKQIEEVALLCCKTKESYNEVLPNGLRAIGAGIDPYQYTQKIIKLVAEQKPTHLVIHLPFPALFQWAAKNKVKTIGLLADSFPKKGLRRQIKHYLLARLLNNQQIEWIANHGINACVSLEKIGVNPDKIIPWDFPHLVTPTSFLPKEVRVNVDTWKLIYVGAVTESKGIGDIIKAIANLKDLNISVKLEVAGKGEIDRFTNLAKKLGIEERVDFLGLIPHHQVMEFVRKADIAIVPSRHEYPEGIPFTIYEALCTRTPLIASDHPMFLGNLQDGVSALIFPAGDSMALAACIEKLTSNPELYHQLSQASDAAWQRLQIPVKWAELIQRWLHNSPENQSWLYEHRLASKHHKH